MLGFNKPMNPAGASDVNNYTVNYATPWYTKPVQLKSAQYDPATQSVTLIPKHPVRGLNNLVASLVNRARTLVRPGQQSNVSQGLTDLQGNPINADTTPGQVGIRLYSPPPIA